MKLELNKLSRVTTSRRIFNSTSTSKTCSASLVSHLIWFLIEAAKWQPISIKGSIIIQASITFQCTLCIHSNRLKLQATRFTFYFIAPRMEYLCHKFVPRKPGILTHSLSYLSNINIHIPEKRSFWRSTASEPWNCKHKPDMIFNFWSCFCICTKNRVFWSLLSHSLFGYNLTLQDNNSTVQSSTVGITCRSKTGATLKFRSWICGRTHLHVGSYKL